MFKAKPQYVIGVDIGTTAVKMVQLTTHGQQYTAVAGAHVPVAANGDGTEAIVRAISDCYDALGTNVRYVVCGLSGPTLAVREFSFPSIPPEEAEQAVILEAELVSPLDMSRSVVDYQLAGSSGSATATVDVRPAKGATGVFAVADKELVRQTTDLVSAAGLTCVLMDVTGLALLNCAEGCGLVVSEQSTCVIDVGASSTQVVLWDPARSPCVRDLPHGVDEIITNLIERQSVPMETVATHFEPGQTSPADDDLASALVSACQPLAAEINSTLRFYMGQGVAAPVSQIHLCGGLALSQAAMAAIGPELVAPTTAWNPYTHIRVPDGVAGCDLFRDRGAGLATATGLAMRSI
jgi:type IV pilus assembly protein PilM